MKSQDVIRQYYEEQYRERPRRRIGGGLKRVHSNLRGMHIERGDRIIDIGCGLGTTGSYLAGLGAIAFGIDISFEATRTTFQSGGYAATLQANAEFLPYADLSFDGATFMGTLEHFIDPAKALREANRVLKPGAQVCFVVPNSEFFLFKFFGGTGQAHEVPRTYEGWCQLFEREGLRVETVYQDIGPGVFDGGSLLRGVIRKFVLFFFNLLPMRYTYQLVFICRSLPARTGHGNIDGAPANRTLIYSPANLPAICNAGKEARMNRQTTNKGAQLLTKVGIIGELLRFLWRRKLWWMIPMIVVLLLFVVLLVFAQGSAVGPFIYTLF